MSATSKRRLPQRGGARTGTPQQSLFTHTFTGLTAGTSYDLRIVACAEFVGVNLVLCGQETAIHGIVAESSATPPEAVTDLKVTVSGTTANLTWTVPADNGAAITQYQVQHNNSGTWVTTATVTSNAASSTMTGYTNSSFTAQTRFRIRHSNSAGDGPWSNVAMAGPGAPTALTGSAQNITTDVLSWTAPSDTGGSVITDYEYRSREIGSSAWGGWTSLGTTGTSGNATRPGTGTDRNKGFEYQVRAVNSSGGGTPSNTVAIAGRPGVPGNFSAAQVSGSVAVDLSWTAPANTGGKALTEYRVEWRADATGNFQSSQVLGSQDIAAPATAARIAAADGLKGGTAYDFRVRARNADRPGDFAGDDGAVGATTVAEPPNTPGNFTVAPTNDRMVRAIWQSLTESQIGSGTFERYRFEYKDSSTGTDWSVKTTQTFTDRETSGIQSLTLPSVDASYDFRLRAETDHANSAWTAVRTVAGKPGTPATLTISDVTATGATLTWTAVTATGGRDLANYEYRWRVKIDGQSPGAGWVSIRSTGPNTLTADVTGLDHATTYEFGVRATNGHRAGFFRIAEAMTADAPITLTLSPAMVSEAAGQTQVTVTAAFDSGVTQSTPTSVTVTLTPSETEPGDYGQVDDFTVTIPANQESGSATFLFTPTQDDLWEAGSLFQTGETLVLEGTAAGFNVRSVGLLIVDDDPRPDTIDLSVNPVSVTEGTSAAQVTVTAAIPDTQGTSPLSTVVSVTVAAGTAEAGDFGNVDGFDITIQPGARSGTATFSITANDDADNDHETVTVSGTAAGFTVNPATLTLIDDDLSATVSATDPSPLTEGGLDGARITVDVVGTNYDSPLFANRFVLESPPSGLTISSVSRESDTRAVLTLAFNGDFPSDTSFVIRLISTATTANMVLRTPAVPVAAETAPEQVIVDSAIGGPGRVTVNWRIAAGGADGYKVQWKGPGESYDASRQIVITDPDTTTADITGLSPSTTYTVRVIATKRLAPDGTPSADATATTAAVSALISSPSSLTERGLNGARLTVDLEGTQYASSLVPGDFGLLPQGTAGLSVASVDRQTGRPAPARW